MVSTKTVFGLLTVFIGLLCDNPALSIPISGIQLGAGEKGVKLGIFSNIDNHEQLEYGLQLFKGEPVSVNLNYLSQTIGIKLNSLGSYFSYNYYLTGNNDGNGLFIRGGLDLQRISAQSTINLDSVRVDSGLISFTCATCGKIQLKTRTPFVNIIPSIGIGWQNQMSNNLFVQFFAGLQYFDLPYVYWSSKKSLPLFAKQGADEITNKINRRINSLGNVLPAASVVVYQRF